VYMYLLQLWAAAERFLGVTGRQQHLCIGLVPVKGYLCLKVAKNSECVAEDDQVFGSNNTLYYHVK